MAGQPKLSEMVDSLPSYPLLRGSAASDGVDMPRLEKRLLALEPLSVKHTDGIRLDFKEGWLLVRPSGTEPKIRITAEAKTEAETSRLFNDCKQAIRDSGLVEGKSK